MQRLPVVIVLAAGLGTRFRDAGGQQDKLLAPLTMAGGTRAVREHVIRAARASGLPWHVVEREHTRQLPGQGMGWSIATGVAATAGAPGWLILPADLPLVRPETLWQVACTLQEHEVVVPAVRGQRGHPVGFSAACAAELLALQGDRGARQVIERHAAFTLELDDLGCILDVDTPEALAQAQQHAG
jgi:molybdenum cofactor cytidylyltransferase